MKANSGTVRGRRHVWLLVFFVFLLAGQSGSAQPEMDPITFWPESVPGEADRDIDPERIGMLGFSAGAHLTAVTAPRDENRLYEPVDDVEQVRFRPDFAVLEYPAYLADNERPNHLSTEI